LAVFIGKQSVLPSLPYHENEHQQSVNDCCSGMMGNLRGDRLHIVINQALAAFVGKNASETLLPHLQNARQQSVNDYWPSIMVNHSMLWRLLSVYIVLTVTIR